MRARYGKDRTFATPILTTCALAGLVPWSEVPPLPFELACLPQSWFRFVRLHVVSYALPALIAIGQAVYHHRPPRNPLTRLVRVLSRQRSLRVLERIQPSSGGYLEATPLTSFVTLSLAACGLADHAVARNAVRFLINGVRPDGSWAIDSNLATWVTTLSINALAAAGELQSLDRLDAVRDWLLKQQHGEPHPYTGAAAGCMGMDGFAGRRARCGRYRPERFWPSRHCGSADRPAAGLIGHARGFSACRIATAVFRPFAADGGTCRLTDAVAT